MDGRIDYSVYSDAQLQEVSAAIDASRYPRNYANLKKELERRASAGPQVQKDEASVDANQSTKIEFSRFSDKQLDESLTAIDSRKYPGNFESLKAERARRGLPHDLSASRAPDPAQNDTGVGGLGSALADVSDGLDAYFDFKRAILAVALILLGIMALVSGEITLGGESRRRGWVLNLLLGGERSFNGKALVLLSMGVITAGCALLVNALGSLKRKGEKSRFARIERLLLFVGVSLLVIAVALA